MTLPKGTAEREVVSKISGLIPRFQDIFDEESFYIFVIVFVISTIVAAIFASRKIEIKDAGHID